MTLLELIDRIEEVAAAQPSIHSIHQQDIYKLNELADVRYCAFAWVQGTHNGNLSEGTMGYQFTLYVVDRLTADESNELRVQSAACDTLKNILRVLSADVDITEYSITPFSHRFTDLCAGAYASVRMTVADDWNCEEEYN